MDWACGCQETRAQDTPQESDAATCGSEATVQNDHVHVQASAPAKWFRVLRWVILIIVIALIIRFLPEVVASDSVSRSSSRAGDSAATPDCAILSSDHGHA